MHDSPQPQPPEPASPDAPVGTDVPVDIGDWVSSPYYGFSGGRVVMDLGCGMVRVRHDRCEITAKRVHVACATAPEIEAAKRRLARIEAERRAPGP